MVQGFDGGAAVVACECWGRSGALVAVRGVGKRWVGARDRALGGAGVHFLFLQDRQLRFQKPVLAPQLRNLRGRGERARDAVALHEILELI